MSGSDSVRTPRKADVAYTHVRQMIVTLELEPGTPIDERQLIDQLQIGRTPVREAIQRLIHEGMITHTPRRGSWVTPLSLTDLQSMIEARCMLEIECARRATVRISNSQIDEIRAKVIESGPQIKEGDGFTSVMIDQYFHLEIARASANRYLVRMTEQLHHALMRYWYVSAIRVGRLDIIVNDHLAIIDAIASRDPDTAQRAVEHHIGLFRDRLRNMVGGPQLEMIANSPADEHEG